jgi:hypothetical protein
LFFSCEQPGGLSAPAGGEDRTEQAGQTDIGYSVAADGVNGEEDSTELRFVFDDPVPDLSAEHISLTNGTGSVTPGALSGEDTEGKTWSLAITVVQAGDITVKITKEGVETGVKTAAVYRKGERVLLSWTAQANGKADEETSTAITIAFSGPVTGLSGEHIRLEAGTGRASAVDLSGSGQTWLLLIAVEQAGTINISITKDDVEPGPKSVTLHKSPEIPPPEKVGITILSPPDTTYYGRNQTFDSTGLVVAWLYSDGSTEEIPLGSCTLTTPNMGRYTTQTVKVKAGGFETSFYIDVVDTDRILQYITVSGPDNKVQTLGKEFDKTGLTVTGHFSDSSQQNLTSLAAIVGYDKFKRGPQTVSVKVNGKTASIEGITTRIGDDAVVSRYTGYGVKTTFIKGEAMTPEKANITFRFNPSGDMATPGTRFLSMKNGGLLLEDFAGFTADYDPDQPGKQTLTMTLDGQPFTIDFYVVDVKPEVWFDFGYMRHAGDPEGHGPGAGKFYTTPGKELVIAPVRYLIGYNGDHSDDAGVSYSWSVSAPHTTSQGGELLHVTPETEGTYTIRVEVKGRNYITGEPITETADAKLVCYTDGVSAEGKTFDSPLKNFGPGQMCEGGTGYGWSLGSAGGYEVWEVDPKPSYKIYGNPLTGWREPGVVWMQEDNNGNGLPDEMWYELPGSDETHPKWKNHITRRYAVTYFKTDDQGKKNEYDQLIKEVYWADSRGRAGMIPGGFPTPWGVTGDKVTYTCTLLRDDGEIFTSDYNMFELDGYVDTTGNVSFLPSRAVRADGKEAKLSAVRFIKVQTSMFKYGGGFGDVSTEIPEADFLPYQAGGFPMP